MFDANNNDMVRDIAEANQEKEEKRTRNISQSLKLERVKNTKLSVIIALGILFGTKGGITHLVRIVDNGLMLITKKGKH